VPLEPLQSILLLPVRHALVVVLHAHNSGLILPLSTRIKGPFKRNTYAKKRLARIDSHSVIVESHDTNEAFKGAYLDLNQSVLRRLA
jgi:hypothetical protein